MTAGSDSRPATETALSAAAFSFEWVVADSSPAMLGPGFGLPQFDSG